jgi:hypothetical protein
MPRWAIPVSVLLALIFLATVAAGSLLLFMGGVSALYELIPAGAAALFSWLCSRGMRKLPMPQRAVVGLVIAVALCAGFSFFFFFAAVMVHGVREMTAGFKGW